MDVKECNYSVLAERVRDAIGAIEGDKCSSDGLWAQGVNDATDKHAEALRAMFSDILQDER